MRHASDARWDDAADGALRHSAEDLRTSEFARADTDEAWASFVRGREHQAASSRRTPRAVARHGRRWVPVVAAGLVAATILALVWLSGRPAAKQPVDLDRTTTTAATSTTAVASTTTVPSTTVVAPVVGVPALILPTFSDGKLIQSLSAVSDSEWFALSDLGPPGRQSYSKLWHTTDGGATWVDMLLPDGIGSGQVHFADPLNGWLIENQTSYILATHDGGASWAPVDGAQARGDINAWPAVAFSGGRVHIFGDVPIEGNSRIGVMSSPVGNDEFVWSGETMGDARWGLTPSSSQLVIRGDVGWAIAYGVTAPPASTPPAEAWPPGALRLIDGEWKAWDPPCARSLKGEQAYTDIDVPHLLLDASSSGGIVAIVCQETAQGSPLRTFVSDDRGATFVEGAPLPDGMTMTGRSWVRVLDDGIILVGAALDTGELVVERSDDSGGSWMLDTSFGGVGDFATMTTTPSGRIVVVATIESSDGSSRDTAWSRDERGIWVALATE